MNTSLRSLFRLQLLLLALVLTTIHGRAAAQSNSTPWYRVFEIGTLGGIWSEGVDLNDLGEVVGNAGIADGTPHAFRWRDLDGDGVPDPAEVADLGSLDNTHSTASAVNNNGQVVGWSWSQIVGEFGQILTVNERPYLYDGAMHDFNDLIPPPHHANDGLGGWDYSISRLNDIDDAGRVVGEMVIEVTTGFFQGSSFDQGVYYRPGLLRRLAMTGVRDTDPRSEMTLVHNSGPALGYSVYNGYYRLESLPTETERVTVAGTVPGGQDRALVPVDTNSSGAILTQVVGEGDYKTGRVYRGNSYVVVPSMELARGMNEAGALVGQTVSGEAGLWLPKADGSYQSIDLNTAIAPGWGWELTEARAINEKGWIVGTGRIDGRKRAVLLVPSTDRWTPVLSEATVDPTTIASKDPVVLSCSVAAADADPDDSGVAEVEVRVRDQANTVTRTAMALASGNRARGVWRQSVTLPANTGATEVQYWVSFAATDNNSNRSMTQEVLVRVYPVNFAVLPPEAPSSLRALAARPYEIDLTWKDNSQWEIQFEVERREYTADTFEPLATVNRNTVTYTDKGLKSRTTYVYRVRSSNLAGKSDYSNEDFARAFPPEPPSAPTDLKARPVQWGRLYITWKDTSDNETRFELQVVDPGGSISSAWPTANTQSRDTGGLDGGTTYRVRLRATNSYGSSDWLETEATTLREEPPAAPTDLQTVPSQTSLLVRWKDRSDNEQSFTVEVLRADNTLVDQKSVAEDAEACLMEGLQPGTPYRVRVSAYNVFGDSAWLEGSATTLQPSPAAPSNLQITGATANSLTVAWQDNSINETGFRVERPVGGGSFVPLAPNVPASDPASRTGGTITHVDRGLAASTTYTYRVVAFNAAGDSPAVSQSGSTLPALPPPAAPSNFRITAFTATSLALAWQDNSINETGFRVERSVGGGSFVPVAPNVPASDPASRTGGTITYVDTGLTANTTHTYRVVAFNAAGDSPAVSQSGSTLAASPVLTALTLAPSSVKGGKKVTGTVVLSGPVSSPLTLDLASSSAAASVPATLTISSGNRGTFSIKTRKVRESELVSITARLNGVTKGAILTVTGKKS
jgi:probable HAF family extracellular repeat protein